MNCSSASVVKITWDPPSNYNETVIDHYEVTVGIQHADVINTEWTLILSELSELASLESDAYYSVGTNEYYYNVTVSVSAVNICGQSGTSNTIQITELFCYDCPAVVPVRIENLNYKLKGLFKHNSKECSVVKVTWDPPSNYNETVIDYYEVTVGIQHVSVINSTEWTLILSELSELASLESDAYSVGTYKYYNVTVSVSAVNICGQNGTSNIIQITELFCYDCPAVVPARVENLNYNIKLKGLFKHNSKVLRMQCSSVNITWDPPSSYNETVIDYYNLKVTVHVGPGIRHNYIINVTNTEWTMSFIPSELYKLVFLDVYWYNRVTINHINLSVDVNVSAVDIYGRSGISNTLQNIDLFCKGPNLFVIIIITITIICTIVFLILLGIIILLSCIIYYLIKRFKRASSARIPSKLIIMLPYDTW